MVVWASMSSFYQSSSPSKASLVVDIEPRIFMGEADAINLLSQLSLPRKKKSNSMVHGVGGAFLWVDQSLNKDVLGLLVMVMTCMFGEIIGFPNSQIVNFSPLPLQRILS